VLVADGLDLRLGKFVVSIDLTLEVLTGPCEQSLEMALGCLVV